MYTAWKVPVFGVFQIRVFPPSDWIREILLISPYSVQMRENTDQKNLKYCHISRSDISNYSYKKQQQHLFETKELNIFFSVGLWTFEAFFIYRL